MEQRLYRSRLVLPVNEPKFIEKAHTRNADLYVLDLEDSIPSSNKATARDLVKKSVDMLKTKELVVYVRVNNDQNLEEDLLAVSKSTANGIVLPKVESAEELLKVLSFLQKHMDPEQYATFNISILIESIKGYTNLEEILSCSSKIDTASYGMEDLTSEFNFIYSPETEKYLDYLRIKLIMLSKLNGIKPMGLVGSITNFKDLVAFRKSAEKAYEIGYEGSSCIHPAQVAILNESFAPSKESLIRMQELVAVFEEAIQNGRASTTFEGKMIDYPHYEASKKTLIQYGFSEGSK
ncbi:CoA ester lyase [Sporosarcina oncorhynchi]|uniref:CoA ester lyase n=1 Tax=Sporosarcina oncorhynchi TaxID=3056444 RepID=A0ABZ0L752_9BACL|nr:CoA ester lyase [Sporosarcina sp. T2O-4]WOV87386.1 CoA ester lyase [Sporosarcina sp. T2O-4]